MRWVVDTHSLVWYFTKDKRLSKRVKEIIQKGERGREEIILPSIVLLEAIAISEKKRIKFDIKKLFEFLESLPNLIIADLNLELIKEVAKTPKILDLHDRVIVAVSQIYEAVILTRDSQIKLFAKTLW